VNTTPTAPFIETGEGHSGDGEIDIAVTGTYGNGVLEGTEQCDDGNLVNGDGCDSPGVLTPGMSAGCIALNLTPTFDGLHSINGFASHFDAGDHIVMTASNPSSGSPTTVTLSVNNAVVQTTPFPGTVEYTFPAATTGPVQWNVDTGAEATWTVSCAMASDTHAPNVTIGFTSPGASPNGNHGWYNTSPVKGTVSADDATTGNSNITSIDCTGVTLSNPQGIGTSPTASKDFSISTDGTTNISCTATDAANNTSSSATTATVKLDATKPSLSLSVTPNSVLLGGTAPIASAGATDATSGVASSSCNNGQPLDTSTVGSHTVTCTATDNAGNTNTGTATYVVGVAVSKLSPPTKSQFKAGSTIPVKFQLTGANGQPISATLAAQLSSACAAKVAFDGQPAVCAVYDPTQNFFQANLNTPKNLTVGNSIQITITVKSGGTTIGASPPLSVTVTK
jgi:cysteine-rich repeat protein